MAMVDLFLDSIKSPETRKDYVDAIRRFATWAGIKTELRRIGPKVIQTKLIEYVVYLKNKGSSYSTQNMIINAVQKYCDAYDIEINFKKIRNYSSEQEQRHDDLPYSIDQLRRLLDAADLRKKAIILVAISTGIRAGAFHGIRKQHLTKLENNVYRIMVYADSVRSRYSVFTTPEAGKAIDDYFSYRQANGEILKEDSPLIREEFNKINANNPRPLRTDGISALIQDMLVKLGMRKAKGKKYERHQIAIMHGFRKFYNTSLVKAGIKPVVVELLMGHKVGLQNNYLRLSENEMLQEYLKAVDLLTISSEKALLREVERLKLETEDLAQLKKNYLDLKLKQEEDTKTMFDILEMTRQNNSRMQLAEAQQSQSLEETKKVEKYILFLEKKLGIKASDRSKMKID
jgi:integrase